MTEKLNPKLCEALRFFTREKEIMSGMLLVCGSRGRTEIAMDGEVGENSVFDLASLTKLFTSLCAMRLREEGRLDFSRTVGSLDSRFRGLQSVTVEQLMSFALECRTMGRIDACENKQEALNRLFGTFSAGRPQGRAYSDIPSMVLKYVIEAAADQPFEACVRRTVLEPAGMRETWARVPPERLCDCQDYRGEYRIEGTRWIHRETPEPGVPHDPKAALLQGRDGDLCGHAGLFSTMGDMTRFCRAILDGKIVSRRSLREMAVNRTGYRRADGSYTQYLGYQCYVRHPQQYYSEIPAYMGSSAFGNAGFTGNHLSVDPERDCFVFFLGNRVRNRLTVLLPEAGKTLTDYGLHPDGTGKIRWKNGEVIPSSVQYVHLKDEHLHRPVAEVLGLEDVICRW